MICYGRDKWDTLGIYSFIKYKSSFRFIDYLLSNNITIPKITIQTFHHFTGKYKKNKFLEVGYYLNPEIKGFEPLNESSWGTSDWHPLRIENDPKKKAYIERLKKDGAIMHEKIRVGFGD